jgi:WD40 repeat protein
MPEERPVVTLDPEPMPMPEPVKIVEPEPVPKPEPRRINGFPIAEQTNYLRLIGPAVSPDHAVFSPDVLQVAAERLTTGPEDPQKVYQVLVWSTQTGEVLQTLTMQPGEFQGMAFSPDGKTLAAAVVNTPDPNAGVLQLWNVETGLVEHSIELSVPPGQDTVLVKGVAFDSEGKLVGLINQDLAAVWTVSDGKPRFQKSVAPASLTSLGFFPGSEILILGTTVPGGDSDGVMSWDMKLDAQRGLLSGGYVRTASHPVFAVSPDLSVMTVLNENSIRRYATQTSGYLTNASLPEFLGENEAMTRMSYSPSGKYVLASVPGRRPLVWRDSDFARIAILGEVSSVGSFAARFTPDSKSIVQLDNPDETDFTASTAVIRTWAIPE